MQIQQLIVTVIIKGQRILITFYSKHTPFDLPSLYSSISAFQTIKFLKLTPLIE